MIIVFGIAMIGCDMFDSVIYYLYLIMIVVLSQKENKQEWYIDGNIEYS